LAINAYPAIESLIDEGVHSCYTPARFRTYFLKAIDLPGSWHLGYVIGFNGQLPGRLFLLYKFIQIIPAMKEVIDGHCKISFK
jgi:hypothetical protein